MTTVCPSYTVRRLTQHDLIHPDRANRIAAELNILCEMVPNPGPAVTHASLYRSVRSNTTWHVIAKTPSGQIVGMATLAARRLARERLYSLEDVAVHPDHQRRGLTERLIEGIIEEATAAGAREIDLFTDFHAGHNRGELTHFVLVKCGWWPIPGCSRHMRYTLKPV